MALAGMAIAPVSAFADDAQTAPKTTHHRMYGFFRTNGEMDDYGFTRFWTDNFHTANKWNPDGVELLYSYAGYKGYNQQVSGTVSIYTGAAIDYIYYAPQYETSITTGMYAAPFVSFNMLTGERKEIGDWASSSVTTKRILDMTYDEKNKKMYAVTFNLGSFFLEEVNPNTGTFTQIATLKDGLGTIAADIDGNLYGIGSGSGYLYKVSATDGSETKIYETGLAGMIVANAMEFDKTDGSLYWAASAAYGSLPGFASDSKNRTYMVRFTFDKDGNVATMDNIDEIGEKSIVGAFYIPYVAAGGDAPAAPADVNYNVSTDGSRKVEISWTNPTTTFDNASLADIKSVTIMRDDEVVKTFDNVEMGQKMSYTDESATDDKEYKYVIYATNSVGDGERAIAYKYLGMDVPGVPGNLFLKVGEGAQSVTISWTAPTQGAHGNLFDPSSVTYDVTRSDGKIIAENTTELSCTDDNIRRLGKYYYTVTAKNKVGSNSAQSTMWVFGKAQVVNAETEFEEAFEDASKFNATWVGLDNNEDGYSFMINSTAPSDIIGDGNDNGAVYIINPLFTPSDVTTTDEWLLAPPLKVEDDDDYVVELSARCFTPENLAVTCGSRNLRGDQQVLADLTLKAEYDKNNYPMFFTYVVDLPKGAGYKCIGLHLTTPVPSNSDRNTLLQINDIKVRHKIAGESTGLASVKASGNSAEQYYSIDGVKLAAPQKGLNIVKTKDGKVVKRLIK